jgi:hypothetical protein
MGLFQGLFARERKSKQGDDSLRSSPCNDHGERHFAVYRELEHEGDHCEEGKNVQAK